MKQLINIPAGILAGLVLILITPVQSAFAHSYNPTNPIVFEEKADLIDFHRAGGEGLGGVAWMDYDADGDLDFF
jgi:hypothetical protein